MSSSFNSWYFREVFHCWKDGPHKKKNPNIFEIGATWSQKTGKAAAVIPFCSNVEDLQQTECTVPHQANKPSHWLVMYYKLAQFSVVDHFENRKQWQYGNKQDQKPPKYVTEHISRWGIDNEQDCGSYLISTALFYSVIKGYLSLSCHKTGTIGRPLSHHKLLFCSWVV